MNAGSTRAYSAPKLPYIGRHTAASYLPDVKWWKIPILKENNGQLPPFMITVGSRTRVEEAADTLPLGKCVMLDAQINCMKDGSKGRVTMLLGIYDSVPILIFESQMGPGTFQIIVREVLSHASFGEYRSGKHTFNTPSAYLIRAGTAGGLNDPKLPEHELKTGDIVSGQFSLIEVARREIVQSHGQSSGISRPLEITSEEFLAQKKDLSNSVFLRTHSSEEVMAAIRHASRGNGLGYWEGGNLSKHFLYDEADEGFFIALRRIGVLSTEMEHAMIGPLEVQYAQAGYNLKHGLVSAIVGTVPGNSIDTEGEGAKKAKQAEDAVVPIAAEALRHIASKVMVASGGLREFFEEIRKGAFSGY